MNFHKLLAYKKTKAGKIWSALLLSNHSGDLRKKAYSLSRSKPFRHAFGEKLTDIIKTEILDKAV